MSIFKDRFLQVLNEQGEDIGTDSEVFADTFEDPTQMPEGPVSIEDPTKKEINSWIPRIEKLKSEMEEFNSFINKIDPPDKSEGIEYKYDGIRKIIKGDPLEIAQDLSNIQLGLANYTTGSETRAFGSEPEFDDQMASEPAEEVPEI